MAKVKQRSRTFYITIAVIAVIIILSIGFLFCTNFGKEIVASISIYTKSQKIDFEQPEQGLEHLDSTLESHDVYLTGEVHATKLSYELQKYMAEYLIKAHDVKYILLELGYSVGEMLNEYLKTGDDEVLQGIIESFSGSMAYNQDMLELFRFYYKLNESLPKEKKIRFIAIDTEHQPYIAMQYMRLLVKRQEGKEIPSSISPIITKMATPSSHYSFTKEEVNESILIFEQAYKSYFEEDYFSFRVLMKNIFESTTITDETAREKAMVDNFIVNYEHFPKGKYFGQFGGYHVVKAIKNQPNGTKGDVKTLAYCLDNEYAATKGKVYSLKYLYNMSYCLKNNKLQQENGMHIPYYPKNKAMFLNPEKCSKEYELLKRANKDITFVDSVIIASKSPAADEYTGK